jgi:branched-chain amino acid transport system substrate-binding protein
MPGRVRPYLVLAVFLAAACGQKAGVGDALPVPTPAAPSAVTAPGSRVLGDGARPSEQGAGSAKPADPTTGTAGSALAPAPPGGHRPRPAAGGAEPPGVAASAPGSTSAPGVIFGAPPTASTGPSSAGETVLDRTGVGDREIVVGVHAPISGAAPLPQEFKADIELYWRWLADRGGVFGRTVRIIVKDDQFNPSRALQVCRELVEVDRVFLLVGIGADQVAACARYADSVGVPYLSPGGAENAVAGLSSFFALSMTFPQQAPLLAQLATRLATTKVAVVVTNTPSYDETFQAMVGAARQAGLTIVRTSRIGKQATQSETLAEAGALKASGAQSVMLLAAPLVFLNLATSAQSQAYRPVWMGPGMTNGLNPVAEVGCPAIAGARFLSPFPQLDVIDRFDPDLRAAARRYNGAEPTDITLVAWGLNKTLHRMVEAAGSDLHRQGFLAALRSGREFATNVFPPLRYSAGRPFGATQAHLLEADCANRRFKTTATFVSSL